jgi:hypothetical protein
MPGYLYLNDNYLLFSYTMNAFVMTKEVNG